MLNKTAAHPILQHDGDLKLFLESDAFSMDIKHKEHKEPGLGESKGMFSSMGFSVGGGGKFIEHDDVSLQSFQYCHYRLLLMVNAVVPRPENLSGCSRKPAQSSPKSH